MHVLPHRQESEYMCLIMVIQDFQYACLVTVIQGSEYMHLPMVSQESVTCTGQNYSVTHGCLCPIGPIRLHASTCLHAASSQLLTPLCISQVVAHIFINSCCHLFGYLCGTQIRSNILTYVCLCCPSISQLHGHNTSASGVAWMCTHLPFTSHYCSGASMPSMQSADFYWLLCRTNWMSLRV